MGALERTQNNCHGRTGGGAAKNICRISVSPVKKIFRLFYRHAGETPWLSAEMEVTAIILAKVWRLCQLSSHSRGFLSRL